MTQRFGHVPALDGIRAVAVVLVMCFHAHVPGFSGGDAGVDVFFALSGFLITTLLLEEHQTSGRIALSSFYARRALRLYPALLAAAVLAIALAALRIPIFDAASAVGTTVRGLPFSLFYTMNIARAADWTSGGYLGHTWSLAIEEQFYLVWPFVVVVLLRRSTPATLGWIAAGLALASASVRAGLDLSGVDKDLLFNATFSHVDGIFAGCALALVWRRHPELLRRVSGPLLVALAVGAAIAVVVLGRAMNVVGYATVVVATLVVIGHVLTQPTSVLSRAFATRPATEIGKRSYGLYLYHWPIFLFLGIDTRPHILVLGFGGAFAAAWLSYALVERPFLRLKDRWAVSRPATGTTAIVQPSTS